MIFRNIPKISLTCDVKIIKATALVKPLLTGPDTKSIKNPSPKIPISNSINPDKNDNNTARCQTPLHACNVSNEAIAVGPIGTSLHDPSNM